MAAVSATTNETRNTRRRREWDRRKHGKNDCTRNGSYSEMNRMAQGCIENWKLLLRNNKMEINVLICFNETLWVFYTYHIKWFKVFILYTEQIKFINAISFHCLFSIPSARCILCILSLARSLAFPTLPHIHSSGLNQCLVCILVHGILCDFSQEALEVQKM